MNRKNIASPYLRILARLIDFAISVFILLVFLWFITAADDLKTLLNTVLLSIIYCSVASAIVGFINLLLTSRLGGTLGKLITGIEIVNPENKHISFKRTILRNIIGYMVSALTLDLGFIWVFIDKERRTWHDMIADTYVVVKKQSGIITGVLGLLLMLIVNILIGSRIFAQIKVNKEVYQQFIQDIQSEVNSNQDEIKNTPIRKTIINPSPILPPNFKDVYIN